METPADQTAQAYGELELSEKRFRMIADAIPNIVWTCSVEGDCDYLNRRWSEYTGLSSEHGLGSGWFQWVHPDDREQMLSTWLQAVEHRTIYEVEYRLLGADGSYRWFKAHAVPLSDDQGHFIHWLGTSADIHSEKSARSALEEAIVARDSEIAQRKQLEEQLRLSQRRMKSVLDSSIDSYIAMDASGAIIEWNNEAERCFGWAREEAIGRSLPETLVPERFRKAHRRGIQAFLADRHGNLLSRKAEMTAMRRDGLEFPVEMKLLAVKEADNYFFAAFVSDITERKQAEETAEKRSFDLMEAEARLKAVLASMRDGLCQLDPEGRLVYLNPAGEKIFGYKLDEVRGKVLHDLVHAPDIDGTVVPADKCTVHCATPTHMINHEAEVLSLRKDGTAVPLQYSAAPLFIGDKHAGAVLVFRDVSEQVKLREERESFVALLAHDLKTPLIAADQVLGALLKGKKGELTAHQTEVVALVKQSNADLLEMVQEVLQVYRYSRETQLLRKEPVYLESVIRDCIKTLLPAANEKDVEIKLEMRDTPPPIQADSTAMRHLFMNLLWNAIKFTKVRGPILVTVEADDKQVQVKVKDSGEGIPAEDLNLVFQPFRQGAQGKRRPGSSGLGLFLCRQIVETHGGTIECSSASGSGAVFTITFYI